VDSLQVQIDEQVELNMNLKKKLDRALVTKTIIPQSQPKQIETPIKVKII
jgi:hypothetical protein